MNLFGKKKAAPAPKLQDSIAVLRDAQSTLEKREKHLEKQMQAARAQAKEKLKAKDKRGAIHLLKRAKLLENEVNKIYGKKSNIDVQVMALENAASNRETFVAMKKANDALRAATAQTDVDKVADVMEDINESIGMADELSEALSQPIGPVMDEDDLTKELEEMEGALADESVLEAPVVPERAVIAREAQKPAVAATSTANVTAAAAPVSAAAASSSSSAGRPEHLDASEAKELEQLEALMNA